MLRRSAIAAGSSLPVALAAPPAADTPATASAAADAARARLDSMFRAHHQTVWRTLRRSGLDAQAAADAGQQAYLVAVRRLDDILPGSERAFLIGTALRLARTSHRNADRLQLEEDMDRHTAGTAAGAADGGADARPDLELLDRVLSRMDPTLVRVFVLFELEGFSSPEIAQALELPVGTIASRLRRAREAFRTAAHRLELALQREGGST